MEVLRVSKCFVRRWNPGGLLRRACAFIILITLPSFSQVKQPDKPPAYDVSSVKPNKSGNLNASTHFSRDSFSAENVTMMMLLEYTYGVRADLISGGPGWVESGHFDLKAKVGDGDVATWSKLSPKELKAMLQPVLVDRFHLKVHTETKILPVYDLVIAKGGAKIKEVPGEAAAPDQKGIAEGGWISGDTELNAHAVPLAALAIILESQLHRTVTDKTGLQGRYDLALTWSRDDDPAPANVPSLFAALQESFGLKLLSGTGPVETLVIDHIEMPSED